MKKNAVYLIVLCTALILFTTSCFSTDFLSASYISHALQTESEITVFSNPATSFEIPVSEDFIELLELDYWEYISESDAPSNLEAMLYFDVPQSKNEQYSRVAVFPNNYALIQRFDGQQFGEKKWFYIASPEGEGVYARLSTFLSAK